MSAKSRQTSILSAVPDADSALRNYRFHTEKAAQWKALYEQLSGKQLSVAATAGGGGGSIDGGALKDGHGDGSALDMVDKDSYEYRERTSDGVEHVIKLNFVENRLRDWAIDVAGRTQDSDAKRFIRQLGPSRLSSHLDHDGFDAKCLRYLMPDLHGPINSAFHAIYAFVPKAREQEWTRRRLMIGPSEKEAAQTLHEVAATERKFIAANSPIIEMFKELVVRYYRLNKFDHSTHRFQSQDQRRVYQNSIDDAILAFTRL